jgi:hypothetical protein
VKNQHGHLSVIVGSYGWPDFWDRIQIHDEHTASAARLTTGANTGIEGVVWSYDGDTLSTIHALLELPAPREPKAPRRSYRAPSSLWLPPAAEHEPAAFLPGPRFS